MFRTCSTIEETPMTSSEAKTLQLSELLWTDVQDDVILDVAQSMHRRARTKRPLEALSNPQAPGNAQNCFEDELQPEMVPLPPQKKGTRGPVDVFGQSHPAKATDLVTCRNCSRQVQAGMFAPHLEKCMGKGRAASRAASKRIQAQTRLD